MGETDGSSGQNAAGVSTLGKLTACSFVRETYIAINLGGMNTPKDYWKNIVIPDVNDFRQNELRVFAARSRRRSSVGRTRGVGEWVGLWRFHPGRSLSGPMIAGHEARPERHDARITVGSLPLCTVDGVIWGRVRGIGLCSDRGSPWRAQTRNNKTKQR